jgi:hypothetical protein
VPIDCHVYSIDLLPCPLCGSSDLDAGLQACQCYGVKCRNCRIRLEMYVPDKWPKGVFKRNAKYSENHLSLCKWVMKQVFTRWNLRTGFGRDNYERRKSTEVFLDVLEEENE